MIRKKFIVLSLAVMMIVAIVVTPMNVFAIENLSTQEENTSSLEIKDMKDLKILEAELNRFVQKNPNSTEEQQDAHLIDFIASGGLKQTENAGKATSESRSNTASGGNYLPGYNNLNSAEKN